MKTSLARQTVLLVIDICHSLIGTFITVTLTHIDTYRTWR